MMYISIVAIYFIFSVLFNAIRNYLQDEFSDDSRLDIDLDIDIKAIIGPFMRDISANLERGLKADSRNYF